MLLQSLCGKAVADYSSQITTPPDSDLDWYADSGGGRFDLLCVDILGTERRRGDWSFFLPSYMEYCKKETAAPTGMATLARVLRMADMVRCRCECVGWRERERMQPNARISGGRALLRLGRTQEAVTAFIVFSMLGRAGRIRSRDRCASCEFIGFLPLYFFRKFGLSRWSCTAQVHGRS